MALDLNNLPKSRHYCRKANAKKGEDAQFHLDWTKGKIDEYKDKFNTDFRLIFYRDLHPFDYYSIPYKIIEENITESHLDERKRWHGYIEKNILKVTRKPYEMVRIDISQYKNHHDEPERTWLVLQNPQSIYDDIEGECYEYPETIANGKNISGGDYLICVLTKKKSKGGKRIIGIGKIRNIEKNGKDRKAHYEWYRNFTVPQTFEFIGGDPRNNKTNSINSIPVEQAPEILSRLLGDFPEKEKPSTRKQFPPGLPKGETLVTRSNSKEGYLPQSEGRPKSWQALRSFHVFPKKTFFGLDKSQSHCFTLLKDVTEEYILYFELGEERLQRKIFLMIDGKKYPAIIRKIRIDRSRPYKLRANDLPERNVIQFGWGKYILTQSAIRKEAGETYEFVRRGGKNISYELKFHHLEENIFLVRFPEAGSVKHQTEKATPKPSLFD